MFFFFEEFYLFFHLPSNGDFSSPARAAFRVRARACCLEFHTTQSGGEVLMSRSPFILRRSTHATAAHTFIRYRIARYFPISKIGK
jgi:hypothetical protein